LSRTLAYVLKRTSRFSRQKCYGKLCALARRHGTITSQMQSITITGHMLDDDYE